MIATNCLAAQQEQQKHPNGNTCENALSVADAQEYRVRKSKMRKIKRQNDIEHRSGERNPERGLDPFCVEPMLR